MCGIVGGAGRLFVPQETMVMQLLMLDTQRGPHSTGLLSVTKEGGQPSVVKCLGTPWELVEVPAFDKLWKRSHKVLLGHNRWATKGKITTRNAHPFTHGHITGVHNGTLRDQKLLKNHKNFEVDSDNIFHDIREDGAEATIKKLDGAYCLVWFDKNEQTLNFIRNYERTMYLAWSKDKASIFWASEEWMLRVASMKSKVEIEQPFALPINTLTKFNVRKDGIDLADDSGKEVEGYKKPYVYQSVNYNTGFNYNTPAESVTFDVNGEVNNSFHRYLHTEGEVLHGVHAGKVVRIHCIGLPDLRNKLIDSKNSFTGEISYEFTERAKPGDATSDRKIIVVKSTGLKENKVVTNITDVSGKVWLKGKLVTPAEFDKGVECGCYWCNTKPPSSVSAQIFWNKAGTEFLCGQCDHPEYRQYFDDIMAGGNT